MIHLVSPFFYPSNECMDGIVNKDKRQGLAFAAVSWTAGLKSCSTLGLAAVSAHCVDALLVVVAHVQALGTLVDICWVHVMNEGSNFHSFIQITTRQCSQWTVNQRISCVLVWPWHSLVSDTLRIPFYFNLSNLSNKLCDDIIYSTSPGSNLRRIARRDNFLTGLFSPKTLPNTTVGHF